MKTASHTSRAQGGFTMVEIAICLAVIGFALVAIIGVLPIGMNVQKDNREETIINFDANYLMNAIRSGSQDTNTVGPLALTNYIISITNISTSYTAAGVAGRIHTYGYTMDNYDLDGAPGAPGLTNGAVIIALLSKPKYVYEGGGNYFSNFITADFRSITGSPMDQGQSQSSRDFAFAYRVTVEVVPRSDFPYNYFDQNFNNFSSPQREPANPWGALNPLVASNNSLLARNMQANLNEIRLRFRWPILPGGKLGNGNAVYRTTASGQLIAMTGAPFNKGAVINEFLIQPQIYTNVP